MATHTSEKSVPKFSANLSAAWRDDLRKIIATSIDTNEKLAKGALGLQERATAWAKDTPFAPAFKLQHDMISQWIDGSVKLARRLWQVEEEAMRKTEEVFTGSPAKG